MYRLIRSFLFLFPPEVAHRLSLTVASTLLSIPILRQFIRWFALSNTKSLELFGLHFKNPIGIAAGFDKNAEHIDLLESVGFGFIEIGSVTHQAWHGNQQPRLFRLPKDRGIINRMGLNNQGAQAISERLKRVKRSVPLFINVAKTPDKSMTEKETINDYCSSITLLKDAADVIVLNISCPNADGGKTFEDPELLTSLLTEVRSIIGPSDKPLLIKVSPDLSYAQLTETIRVCEQFEISGYTATNTTVNRDGLSSSSTLIESIGKGGLSGAPLHERALQTVMNIRSLTSKPIIGVGGIVDAVSAQQFISAGASLVQLYTGFVYGGPFIVKRISKDLRD